MLLVAVAWIYVVGLMAATQPTFIAGFFTFLFYCVIPVSILYYLTGGRRRRAKRERIALLEKRSDEATRLSPVQQHHARNRSASSDPDHGDSSSADGGDGGD